MKTTHFFHITLFLTFPLLLLNAPAQEYIKWSLPDGAVACIGKGGVTGNIGFLPDGTILLWKIR